MKSCSLKLVHIHSRDEVWDGIRTYLLTYSMQQSPSWEANWFCC